ncbi:MAG: hypothetical protein JSV77_05915 [Dehalococcoidales bacterium]|nr:MAG: hypothetical protein JSV77_05915 [Dehalococcoidales bacterium]
MGILGSKDKNNSSNAPEEVKQARRKHIELLGREFSIVKDGLDPEEVANFLETTAGSSEAAFKRLNQFTAFQSVAKTMEESIQEARQLAEHAKAQAKLEVQRERTKATEEVRQQVSAILDQTTRSCVASVDDIHSVLLEAIARTEEIQREAFQRTREMVATNLAEIHQNIQDAVDGNNYQVDSGIEVREEVSELPVEVADTIDTADESEIEDAESEEEPAFDLANLQESLMSLEASLSNLSESKNAFEQTPEITTAVLEESDEQELDDVEDGEEDSVESENDSLLDTIHPYSGEVTVEITGGAEESWMQELRQRMSDIPGARIRAESGVDEKTTMVSLSLDEPIKLFPILLSLPRVNRVIPGRLNGGSADKTKLRLWPKAKKNSQQNTITVELTANGLTEPSMVESEDDMIAAS